MRKHLFMLSLMTIFILSCSQNDEKTTIEPVNGVFTKSSFKKQIEELTTNAEFKNVISNRFNPQNFKSGKQSDNQGNGAFVVQNNLGVSFFGFLADGNIIIAGPLERGTLTILPNGLAHFQYKSNGPFCDILDENWNTLYSNQSYEVKTGDFFANFISTYVKFDLDFGGGPFTIYFPNELQSSSVLKMNTTVNNSFAIFDVDYNWIGWTDATVEKNVSIKTVRLGNSKANPVFQVDIN